MMQVQRDSAGETPQWLDHVDVKALQSLVASVSEAVGVGITVRSDEVTTLASVPSAAPLQMTQELSVGDGRVIRIDFFCDDDIQAKRAWKLIRFSMQPWIALFLESRSQKERLSKYLQEVYRDLAIKNRKYKHAIERLDEVDRLKSNFLATISHELRTPLTSVIGYSEMLLEGLGGQLMEEQKEYVTIILSKADHLLQIITGILDVSLLESGAAKLKSSAVSLTDLIDSALAALKTDIDRHKITIHRFLDAVPMGLADAQKLKQVLLHLIANAIKFSPEGGDVSIGLEIGPLAPEDPSVFGSPFWKGSLSERFGLRLSVTDAGIGIPLDEQPRIFEPFFQVDQGATRAYGGTGLGLSLVKGYIEAHGGSIWVESTKGQGATFFVSIPAVAEELELFAHSNRGTA